MWSNMQARSGAAAVLFSALAAAAIAMQGCAAHPVDAPAAAQLARVAQSTPAAQAGAAAAKHPLELIGKVKGSRWHVPWYTRDPKHPNGPPIPVLIAEAATGEIARRNGSPEIVMRKVHARIFQKGVHAADLDAGKVRANQQEKRVFASGGCKVVSVLNPADTVVTADRITWDAANAQFVAEGHAHVVRTPRDGGLPISQEGGRIIYDLAHNTVTVL
jgi:hypothetical protein